MNYLNTREVAVMLWVVAGCLFIVCRPDTRRALGGVLRSLLRRGIIGLLMLGFAYQAVTIWTLHRIGFWGLDLAKDTIIWIILYPSVMLFRIVLDKNPIMTIRGFLRDGLKAIIVIEYLVNLHTFPILVEVPLVFVNIFLGVMSAATSRRPEHRAAYACVVSFQLLILFAVLLKSIYELSADAENVFSLAMIRSFALPIILTVTTIPMVYITRVVTDYVELFRRVDICSNSPPQLRRYIRYRAILYGLINITRIQGLRTGAITGFSNAKNRQDVEKVLDDIERAAKARDRI